MTTSEDKGDENKKTRRKRMEVSAGGRTPPTSLFLTVFLWFHFVFLFLTWTNCDGLQQGTGYHKTPTHTSKVTEDTAMLLVHTGKRKYKDTETDKDIRENKRLQMQTTLLVFEFQPLRKKGRIFIRRCKCMWFLETK